MDVFVTVLTQGQRKICIGQVLLKFSRNLFIDKNKCTTSYQKLTTVFSQTTYFVPTSCVRKERVVYNYISFKCFQLQLFFTKQNMQDGVIFTSLNYCRKPTFQNVFPEGPRIQHNTFCVNKLFSVCFSKTGCEGRYESLVSKQG